MRNLPIWEIDFIWGCHDRPILKGRRFSRVYLSLHVWLVSLFFVHKYAHKLVGFLISNPVLYAIKVWRQITRLMGSSSFDALVWDIWPAAIESHSFDSRLIYGSREDMCRVRIQHVLVLFSFSKVVDYLRLICSVDIRLGYLFTQRRRISSSFLFILKSLHLFIIRYRLRMGAFDHYFWQKFVFHSDFLLPFLLHLLCWLRPFSWLWFLNRLTCFEFNVERGAIASIGDNKFIIPRNFLAS